MDDNELSPEQLALERIYTLFIPHVAKAIRPEIEAELSKPPELPTDEAERQSVLTGLAGMLLIDETLKRIEDGTLTEDEGEHAVLVIHSHIDFGVPASPELAAALAAKIPEVERRLAEPLSADEIQGILDVEAHNRARNVVDWWHDILAEHAEFNGWVIKTAVLDDCLLPPDFEPGPTWEDFVNFARTEEQFRAILRDVKAANPDLGPLKSDLAVVMAVSFDFPIGVE